MGIFDRITDLSTKADISITRIEKECGLGHGTIRRWNKNYPTVDKAKAVADFLQVSFEWLVTGKTVENMTEDEKKLIEHYRNTAKTGKNLILKNAKEVSDTLPKEQESSTSKIG